MHSTPTKSYPYRPRWTSVMLAILFFGACAGVLAWKAATNDRGLIFSGLFEMSPEGATVFYWVLAALSFGFVFTGILLAVRRLMGSAQIEISDSAVTIPQGFIRREVVRVEFSEVVDHFESEFQGQRFFYLHTPGGRFCVNRVLMPSNAEYEEAKALITAAIVAQGADDRAGGALQPAAAGGAMPESDPERPPATELHRQ